MIYFRHMLYTQTDKDPLESFLNRLLNDAVQEASVDIVRETVREMAHDYVKDKHHEVVFDDLFNDFMDEIGASVVSCLGSFVFLKFMLTYYFDASPAN